jgi:DNA-binding NarL/FixJ family response regulator
MNRAASVTDYNAESAEPIPIILAGRGAGLRRALREAAIGPHTRAIEAGDAGTAIRIADEIQHGVLALTLDLPDLNAFEICRTLSERAPEVRILVVTSDPEPELEWRFRALMAGAAGVVPAAEAAADLAGIALDLSRGASAVEPELTALIVRRYHAATALAESVRPVTGPLSAREWEVVDALAGGSPTGEVARELGIAASTVHSHLRNVFRKLGVASRREAIAAAETLRSGARPGAH